MAPSLPLLPETVPDLSTAEAFSDLYINHGPSLRQKLAQLELQSLFLLLMDTLESPGHHYDQLRLAVDSGSIWIELGLAATPEDTLLIADEAEEIGARAMCFMSELPYLNEDHGFVSYLVENALTRQNKWQMAARLLGREAASAMQAASLQHDTVVSAGLGSSRPRM